MDPNIINFLNSYLYNIMKFTVVWYNDVTSLLHFKFALKETLQFYNISLFDSTLVYFINIVVMTFEVYV